MNLKWITAIVVIFGLLTMFYIFNWMTVLKPLLILLCVVLIGMILLQAGKGGGLAAIGGLADQTALGTRTSTFLGKLTYLVGAVFIFTAILLTKLTLTSIHGTETFKRGAPITLQEVAHEGHDHQGRDHTQDLKGAAVEQESMAMKETDATDTKQGVKEIEGKSEND